MKTLLSVLALGVSLGAHRADAQGLDIGWDVCGAAGALSEKVLDCADVSAVDEVVVTFQSPVAMTGFAGLEAVLFVTAQDQSVPLPDYWQFGPGGCNELAFNISKTPPAGSGAACISPWGSGTVVPLYETPHGGNPSRARIAVWISNSGGRSIAAGTNYFGFRLLLGHDNVGICEGCGSAVYITLQSLTLRNNNCPPGPSAAEVLTTPILLDQIAANGSLLGVGSNVATLSLSGALQNPVSGRELVVAFSLPDGAPAWLELLDVAGRRVARREVGAFGAGHHRVRLSDGGPFRPGVYQLRLSNGRASGVRKTVIVQ